MPTKKAIQKDQQIGKFSIGMLNIDVTIVIGDKCNKFIASNIKDKKEKKEFLEDSKYSCAISFCIGKEKEGEGFDVYIGMEKNLDRNVFFHECTHAFFQVADAINIELDSGEFTARFGGYFFDNALRVYDEINEKFIKSKKESAKRYAGFKKRFMQPFKEDEK